MAANWDALGDLANVAQLTGLDAIKLIGMIVKAATTARMHKKNCRQFALHLKLIGNLLEQLRISELKKYPETREPLEQLEDALRRSYVLISSCQDRSYLYLLAMGWNIVYQFRKAQTEIDRYLKLVPLIALVDNARVRERLEDIEKDQREYTLDEEDEKVKDVILTPAPSVKGTCALKSSLSCRYPNLGFDEALKKENEKLQMELRRSQASMDFRQCEVIQQLLEVTESAANSHSEDKPKNKTSKHKEHTLPSNDTEKGYQYEETCQQQRNDAHTGSRNTSPAGHDLVSTGGSYRHEEWHSDLLGCCSEPSLCFKTFFYPCGTFSKIATVASKGKISPEQACNDLMTYSLILSCCCYTCCMRRKLRKMLNITGGLCDDFLSHLMCCCCALVQEWREVEIRGAYGPYKTKTSPPPSQVMES
ncbi:protein MID1-COMPLEMENTING ACTIVITY 1 [Nymphaea colorata]|nr:protein MID1-COMPLEMENTING ACTIVITY 1 [Nymphaea colorata]XP_031494837.1 protein MID1-COMPLEMENTING ACTIVITY 1 [Nymphaea colorata]XP_031494838.1 protein MID1-COMPLEMENTING ACTIVITY 1 [Nymphaea colorata]XP_031494839.1 protein MID1-COMPLEMENTING ACTIVITY 1 [Nymphaea colorata]